MVSFKTYGPTCCHPVPLNGLKVCRIWGERKPQAVNKYLETGEGSLIVLATLVYKLIYSLKILKRS
jgi:hypothetical protein